MKFPRASGILLHPTSLPGEYGIGDLGDKAYEFVNFLVRAKQTYWQTLPLEPTGWGDSPYSSFSAFAGNTLLISPDKLVEDGLLQPENLHPSSLILHPSKVDYGAAYEFKNRMLRTAFESFQNSDGHLRGEFEAFVRENGSWLDD